METKINLNKVLPTTPTTTSHDDEKSKMTTNLKTFKSILNNKIDLENRRIIIQSSAIVQLKKNSSVLVELLYGHIFDRTPWVEYFIVCGDELFELSHYLKSIETSKIVVALENHAESDREITIIYKAL